ncbi:protein kinase [Polyangium jinanense]|uniref:serine/threonine-protein kinase n=1 Tax=Polyangium jinanense TaxID=2829994 RepID=UPI002341C54E|nr:serine/threonine-protein kinase [Polyangium jinanense]MDC3956933.1 protein kinase [Polyangium jinanense]
MKPGDTIGAKYRLIQKIGEGAMGSVWSGENLSTGRKVALKLILKPTLDLRERLLREARACGKLSHPNIVELLDVGETGTGEPFLVMELLQGQTLGDLLKAKRRIAPPIAARIGRDIANALAVAHAAKIIHRDLKPANIFLHRAVGAGEDEFVVKVVDFGVAKNLESADGPATVTGAVVGSPAYMSPEQVGMRKDLDHRTDIWSLGIVLYEMLAGSRPFSGSVEDVVRQILLAPIAPVSSKVRGISPELDEIVAKCLDRDRGKRFAHAADLSRALAAQAETSRSARIQINVPAAPSSSPDRRPTLTGIAPSTLAAQPAPAQERRPSFTGQTPSPLAVQPTPGPAASVQPAPAMERRPSWTGQPAPPPSTAPTGTQPMAAPQRPPSFSGYEPPPPSAPRATMGSAPMMEDEDLVATQPMQGRAVLADLMQRRNASVAEAPPGASPTGTQLLMPNQPVASPGPNWREAMKQALEAKRAADAHRQSSPVDALQGGTMAIPSDLVERVASGVSGGVTTSTGGMVHPIPASPTADPELAGHRARRRSSAGIMYAAIGVGILAVTVLAVFLVLNLTALVDPSGTPTAEAATAQTPEESPVVPAAMATTKPTSEAAPAEPVKVATVEPPGTNAVSAPQPPAPSVLTGRLPAKPLSAGSTPQKFVPVGQSTPKAQPVPTSTAPQGSQSAKPRSRMFDGPLSR